MEPMTRTMFGADWLSVKPTECSGLPVGLALKALREHPEWSSGILLNSVSVDSALDAQISALTNLFNEVHALRSAPLDERPQILKDKAGIYEQYKEKLALTFFKKSIGELVSSCSSERVQVLSDLEYEYPELISTALTLKLKESEGTLEYKGGEPVNSQFVKDLLFAIQNYDGLVYLDFSDCKWEEGALSLLEKGLETSTFAILNSTN